MRISSTVITAPIARDTRDSAPTAKSGEAAAPSSASVVKLSSAGTAASAETASAGPTTTSRLQTIRAMLDKGSYPVDLDALASRIVDDEVVRSGRS